MIFFFLANKQILTDLQPEFPQNKGDKRMTTGNACAKKIQSYKLEMINSLSISACQNCLQAFALHKYLEMIINR